MVKKSTKEHRDGFSRKDNDLGTDRRMSLPKGPRVAEPDGPRSEPDQHAGVPGPIPDDQINID